MKLKKKKTQARGDILCLLVLLPTLAVYIFTKEE